MIRIVKLADGEELISYEIVERAKVCEDDPRRELLEHRRRALASREWGPRKRVGGEEEIPR